MKKLLALSVLAVGCASSSKGAATPTLVLQDLAVTQSLTEYQATFAGTLEPQADSVLEAAVYELVQDGAVVKKEDKSLQVELPAGKATPFSFTDGQKWVADAAGLKAMDAKGGSILTAFRGVLRVRTGKTKVEIPFARSRDIRVPRQLKVGIKEIKAARYADNEAQVTAYFAVENPNPFPVAISGLAWTAQLSGKNVGEGTLGPGEKIGPSSTAVFDIQVGVNEASHGKDIKPLIKSGKLAYTLRTTLKAELLEEQKDFSDTLKIPGK